MIAETLPINWHKGYIMSCDFGVGRFVTSGLDNRARVWRISYNDNPTAEHKFTVTQVSVLTLHHHAVNSVRFSPDGQQLATCSDDQKVRLWQLKATKVDTMPEDFGDDAEEQISEHWEALGPPLHRNIQQNELVDMTWAPDGHQLLCTSYNNTITMFRLNGQTTASKSMSYNHHSSHCQGVAWDPVGRLVVTQGDDAAVKVYIARPNARTGYCDLKLHATIKKATVAQMLSAPADIAAINAMFPDNDVPQPVYRSQLHHLVFFRRPAWTPDGAFVVTVTGQYPTIKTDPETNQDFVAWCDCAVVYSRQALEQIKKPTKTNPAGPPPRPTAILPFGETVVAAQAHPGLFASDEPEFDHFAIIAVASLKSIVIYRSDTWKPVSVVQNAHFTPITDLAWRRDAGSHLLAVTSTDGFVTFVRFEELELGTPVDAVSYAGYPAHMVDGYKFELEKPVAKKKVEEKEKEKNDDKKVGVAGVPAPAAGAVDVAAAVEGEGGEGAHEAQTSPMKTRPKRARVAPTH